MIARGSQVAASLLVAWMSAAAPAADNLPPATEPPLRLSAWLAADVGLCLELDNVAERWTAFAEGPLHDRIRRFPPVVEWLSRHRPELAALSDEIERRTGATAREVGLKLLGRQVLFAIWPPANPVIDKPTALLLAESADEDLLRRVLDRFVAARRQAGRWRGRHTLEVAGDAFSVEVVVPDDEESEFFVTTVGKVAVIATSEALVRGVLERRDAAETQSSSLAASAAYLASNQRLAKGHAARLFINPRAWDAALTEDLKKKEPSSEEAKSQAAVVAAWRATEYVTAGAQITPQLGLELAWKWQADALPEPLREVAGSLTGRSQFLDQIPADSLLAFAGHIDVTRLVRYAIVRQWREAADGQGKSTADQKGQRESVFLWALAAGFGPDLGAYLTVGSRNHTAPSPDRPLGDPAAGLPADLVLAIQTRPLEQDDRRPALAQSLEPVLHALLAAAVGAVNRQAGAGSASIQSATNNGQTVTSVTGFVPGRPRQELAYCVDQRDRFWLGTSAAALERAASSTPGDSLLDQPAVRGSFASSEAQPGGLLYANLAGWRALALKGPESLDFLWEGKHLDAGGKEQHYRAVLAVAHLADWLVAAMCVDESTVRLSVAVGADGP